MRELLSLSRVPTFDSEDVIRRTVTCERCLEPGLYRLDVASGHFSRTRCFISPSIPLS